MSRKRSRSGPHHDANVGGFFADHFGIRFADDAILLRAVTHSSYAEEAVDEMRHNQRLEFLGDSVVGVTITEALYRTFSDEPEGNLSKMKARLVSTKSLATAARRHELGRFLRLGRGEERTSGRDKERLLADVFESVAGAIFLDRGFAAARDWVLRLLGPEIAAASPGLRAGDFKSELQEFLQGERKTRPRYITLGIEGPAHEQVFTVGVDVDDVRVATGTGTSKKSAQQSAARAALEALTIRPDGTKSKAESSSTPRD